MAVRFHALATVGITALLTAGCSMMPFGRDEPVSRAPAPLAAAPTGLGHGSAAAAARPAIDAPPQTATGLAALDPSAQAGAPRRDGRRAQASKSAAPISSAAGRSAPPAIPASSS